MVATVTEGRAAVNTEVTAGGNRLPYEEGVDTRTVAMESTGMIPPPELPPTADRGEGLLVRTSWGVGGRGRDSGGPNSPPAAAAVDPCGAVGWLTAAIGAGREDRLDTGSLSADDSLLLLLRLSSPSSEMSE